MKKLLFLKVLFFFPLFAYGQLDNKAPFYRIWGPTIINSNGYATFTDSLHFALQIGDGKAIIMARGDTANIPPDSAGLIYQNSDNTIYYANGLKWLPLGGGSTGGVDTVKNTDGTLTISPNTGNVVSSLNINHYNNWNASMGIIDSLYFNNKAWANIYVDANGEFCIGARQTRGLSNRPIIISRANSFVAMATDTTNDLFDRFGSIYLNQPQDSIVNDYFLATMRAIGAAVGTATPEMDLECGFKESDITTNLGNGESLQRWYNNYAGGINSQPNSSQFASDSVTWTAGVGNYTNIMSWNPHRANNNYLVEYFGNFMNGGNVQTHGLATNITVQNGNYTTNAVTDYTIVNQSGSGITWTITTPIAHQILNLVNSSANTVTLGTATITLLTGSTTTTLPANTSYTIQWNSGTSWIQIK